MDYVKTAVEFCEAEILRQSDYCLKNKIYPKWPGIADSLLSRRVELTQAYCDIYQTLDGNHRGVYLLVDAIFCSASVWGVADVDATRQAKKRLEKLNCEIADAASDLSALLQERSDLENRHSLGADTYYHIIDAIEGAGREHHQFVSWVKDDLDALRGRFDLKYWPALADVIEEISSNSREASVVVYSRVTEAALQSRRSSKADFVRAMLQRVAECKGQSGDQLPTGFKLKDESWASIINCVLDLDADALVDGSYVKGLRHRVVKA